MAFLLIYKEIVFTKELNLLTSNYQLKVIPIITRDPKFKGLIGRIDAEKIKNLVPDVTERDSYICGPQPMLISILKDLKTLNIPRQQIHFERFSL